MNNEKETLDTVEEMNNEQYIEAIENMKANTVSLEAYNKLRGENKKLLDALVNGEQIDAPAVEKPDINALRNKLFNNSGDISNLDYIDTALKLRSALIEAGEPDPFLPIGDKVTITPDIIETAERVANGLQAMVDFSEGDSGIFTAQYQRMVKDSGLLRNRK